MKLDLKNTERIIVVIRGGGDIATGVAQQFYRKGFWVAILETAQPQAIRRTVSLSTAVYTDECQVEEMKACKVNSPKECEVVWKQRKIPVLIDPKGEYIKALQPTILIDGIIAKKNLGTHRNMAPITIGLGPGFEAGVEVDVAVETMRGQNLGQLYFEGTALPDTGIPGEIGGKSIQRVIYASHSGKVTHIKKIGDQVEEGEEIFYIDQFPVPSPIDGTIRGLIHEGLLVKKGLKCGDVDPRPHHTVDCYSISDKAKAIGKAALEAALFMLREKEKSKESSSIEVDYNLTKI